MSRLFGEPAFARALVVGCFGGVGLVLTTFYSRRGPLIFPVYAALLASLAVLLARFADLPFAIRLGSALGGFVVAAGMHYVAVLTHANRERHRLGIFVNIALAGHIRRLSLLLLLGLIACAGVAFVSS